MTFEINEDFYILGKDGLSRRLSRWCEVCAKRAFY